MSENLPYGLLKQCSTINKLFIELEIITRNNFFVIVIHKHINLTKPESELHDGMSYEPRPKFHATKITSHVSNHSYLASDVGEKNKNQKYKNPFKNY